MVRCHKTDFKILIVRRIDRGITHFPLFAAQYWTVGIRPLTAMVRRSPAIDGLRLLLQRNRREEQMKSPIRQCGLLLMALTVCTEPALAARSYLNCQTKKAIIIDAPNGKSSLSTEENVGFWVDDAAKTITLEDGTPFRRFDDRWIGAARDDVSYELDRQDENLAYASSTTKDGVTTIVIGYGRCKLAAGPAS